MTSPSQETQGVGALSFEQRHEIARAAMTVADQRVREVKALRGIGETALALAVDGDGWRLFALAITEAAT